jgi:putative inorganic carbon (HCO3(-)) transporter
VTAPPLPTDVGARVALGTLAIVLLVAPLAVDSSAEAAFDAPKRFVVLLGSAIAAAAALVLPGPRSDRVGALGIWRAASARARVIAWLVAGAVAAAVLAALSSPRAALSLGALRMVLPMALLLPLGASRVLARAGGAVLLAAFVAGASVDALASVLERAGLVQLFAVESAAGRGGTGAFVGNEGSLALLLALGAVAALAVVLQARTTAWRAAAAAALVVQLLGLAANPGLTALLALLAGASVVAVAAVGRRALLLIAGAVALLGVAVVAVPPLRARVTAAAAAARSGDWDALLTYRLGPWAAAEQMVRERPLLGFGPGTFGAEFATRRLAAELRHRRRFVLPRETSTFAEAHDDYLQLAAECGVPALLAALAALGLLLGSLGGDRVTAATDDGIAARGERVVIVGLVASAAVAALAWFPLQLAVTAPALLLALGRGWRLVADGGRAAPAATAGGDPDAVAALGAQPAVRGARAFAAAVLVLIVVVPELRRYGAERELSRATSLATAYLASRGAASPRMLDDARAAALASAVVLPADPRPVLAAGGIELLAKNPRDALTRYREALVLGERAETDLNAGRALAMLDQRPEALAAFVRTGWLSPYLVPSMPNAAQPLVRQETARLAEQLSAGALAAPPPLPDVLRVP